VIVFIIVVAELPVVRGVGAKCSALLMAGVRKLTTGRMCLVYLARAECEDLFCLGLELYLTSNSQNAY
jgi:hypothetical protein